MFPVSGWAVSAEMLAAGTKTQAQQSFDNSSLVASKSMKRKRNHHGLAQQSRVSSENLDQLWNQYFGGGSHALSAMSSVANQAPRSESKARDDTSRDPSSANSEERSVVNGIMPPQRMNVSGAVKRRSSKIKDKKTREKQFKQRRPETNSSPPNDLQPFGRDNTAIVQLPQDRSLASSVSVSNHRFKEDDLRALPTKPPPPTAVLTPLQAKMRDKLTAARFRHLNQTLYTTPSSAALDLFSSSPDLFAEYHAGFLQQVRDSWPENPVEAYIRDIKMRGELPSKNGKDRGTVMISLPRRKTGSCTIADLGCGDAPIARACQSQSRSLNLKIHSFDLHASNALVTRADVADLPLRDGEADIAIFCLSLMGTNWISFVEEAWRILRGDGKGEVWVAEVKSRFGRVKRATVDSGGAKKKMKSKGTHNGTSGDSGDELRVGSAENSVEDQQDRNLDTDATDVSAFVQVFQRRGFVLREGSINKRNKMFVSMVFGKSGTPTAGKHRGMKWNGCELEKQRSGNAGQMRFIDDAEGLLSPDEEAKVLKPCVYKTR